jgi:hypothetical protein
MPNQVRKASLKHGTGNSANGRFQEEHDASIDCDIRDIGRDANPCGIHTRKSRHAIPGRDACGRERIE